ncbi:Vmc-like lipoprotein signal peptide domain-containing protein [Ureaplasma canigenitalium]|nr:hypothetical protein [Ureaplasma canigenitalium]
MSKKVKKLLIGIGSVVAIGAVTAVVATSCRPTLADALNSIKV